MVHGTEEERYVAVHPGPIAGQQDDCKRLRAEASMKTKNRKEGNAGSMESLELTHSMRERQRER